MGVHERSLVRDSWIPHDHWRLPQEEQMIIEFQGQTYLRRTTHFRNNWLNEDLGCRIEGALRRELLSEGEYHGVLRMDLCRG